MLIPLGFWAASGAGGGSSAGAFELISTATGTGSSGVVTFSSIPTTYKHLQIRYVAKNTTTGNVGIQLNFNSDTGANYAYHTLTANGTSVSSSAVATGAFTLLNVTMAQSTVANITGAGIIDILDYASTTKNKTTRTVTGLVDSSPNISIGFRSGLWLNTASISSITLTASGGSYATLSRFSLYGIKG